MPKILAFLQFFEGVRLYQIRYLSLFDEEQFINNNFKNNVTYYKIYQDAMEGQIILSLKNDNISFEDFMLLIIYLFFNIYKNK